MYRNVGLKLLFTLGRVGFGHLHIKSGWIGSKNIGPTFNSANNTSLLYLGQYVNTKCSSTITAASFKHIADSEVAHTQG